MGNAPDALVWRLLGRTAFTALLYPVVGSTGSPLLVRVKRRKPGSPVSPTTTTGSKNQQLSALSTFRNAMLDKIASWRGELQLGRDVCLHQAQKRHLTSAIRAANCSGLASWRCGSVPGAGKNSGLKTINALVFSENAQRFKQIMQRWPRRQASTCSR